MIIYSNVISGIFIFIFKIIFFYFLKAKKLILFRKIHNYFNDFQDKSIVLEVYKHLIKKVQIRSAELSIDEMQYTKQQCQLIEAQKKKQLELKKSYDQLNDYYRYLFKQLQKVSQLNKSLVLDQYRSFLTETIKRQLTLMRQIEYQPTQIIYNGKIQTQLIKLRQIHQDLLQHVQSQQNKLTFLRQKYQFFRDSNIQKGNEINQIKRQLQIPPIAIIPYYTHHFKPIFCPAKMLFQNQLKYRQSINYQDLMKLTSIVIQEMKSMKRAEKINQLIQLIASIRTFIIDQQRQSEIYQKLNFQRDKLILKLRVINQNIMKHSTSQYKNNLVQGPLKKVTQLLAQKYKINCVDTLKYEIFLDKLVEKYPNVLCIWKHEAYAYIHSSKQEIKAIYLRVKQGIQKAFISQLA